MRMSLIWPLRSVVRSVSLVDAPLIRPNTATSLSTNKGLVSVSDTTSSCETEAGPVGVTTGVLSGTWEEVAPEVGVKVGIGL